MVDRAIYWKPFSFGSIAARLVFSCYVNKRHYRKNHDNKK
jgi:hypothetical protein